MSKPRDETLRVFLNQDCAGAATYRTFEVHGVGDELLTRLRTQPPSQAEWGKLLAVFVLTGDASLAEGSLPMWGSCQVERDLIRFIPAYPLCEGHRYCVRLHLGNPRDTYFSLPLPNAPSPQVLHIYPSANVLPENLLRFYVYFSQPMRQGQAQTQIRLYQRDNEGNGEHEISEVFLDPPEELWNFEQTRLTVILDPSRVKTGLYAHHRLGRSLVPGRKYRLEVGRGFRAAHGGFLKEAFSKDFSVEKSSTVPLSVSQFQLLVPQTQTQTPLRLRLPRPMDHVLLAAFLEIRNSAAQLLAGQISLEEDESLWNFIPQCAWEPGCHTLEIDLRLEDLAGNNLQQSFDRPRSQIPIRDQRIVLPFTI